MDKGVVALPLAFYSVVPCCASKMAESICRSIRDGALEGELAPALTIKDSLASPFAFDVFSYILVQLSSHIMAGKFQSCGIVIIALSRSPSSYTGLLKMKGVDIASSKKWIHIVVRETRKVASISIALPSDPPPMASISIALTTSSPCPTLPSLRLRSSSPKSPPLSYSTFNFKPLTFSISSNVAFNTNIKV